MSRCATRGTRLARPSDSDDHHGLPLSILLGAAIVVWAAQFRLSVRRIRDRVGHRDSVDTGLGSAVSVAMFGETRDYLRVAEYRPSTVGLEIEPVLQPVGHARYDAPAVGHQRGLGKLGQRVGNL